MKGLKLFFAQRKHAKGGFQLHNVVNTLQVQCFSFKTAIDIMQMQDYSFNMCGKAQDLCVACTLDVYSIVFLDIPGNFNLVFPTVTLARQL